MSVDTEKFSAPSTRWPHDKYRESRSSRSESRSDKYRSRIQDFDQRRKQREKISLVGVPQVWGLSPTHIEKYVKS